MRNLRNSQAGLVLMLAIIGVIAVLGYIVINNFLKSDQGQNIQETKNKVIDTIETTKSKVSP